MANDFRFMVNMHCYLDFATEDMFKYPRLMKALLRRFNEIQENGEISKRIKVQEGITPKFCLRYTEALDYFALLLLGSSDEAWELCNQCGNNYIKNYYSTFNMIQLIIEGDGVGLYSFFEGLRKSCNFQKIEIIPANTSAKQYFGENYQVCLSKDCPPPTPTANENVLMMSRLELKLAYQESPVKVQKCIVNSKGEKVFVGDRIEMNLAVTSAGNEVTITAIEDDHIILDGIVIQPLASVQDFTIIQSVSKG